MDDTRVFFTEEEKAMMKNPVSFKVKNIFCGNSQCCGSGSGLMQIQVPFYADPDPYFYLMRIRIRLFTLMRIRMRIQILASK
jgi:hypothetical protein